MINKTVIQPLDPSIRSTLDPEYVAFHDNVLQYVQPAESETWTPHSRLRVSPLASQGQKIVEVGDVVDRNIGDGVQIRIFLPEKIESTGPDGNVRKPAKKPWLVWLHGGGWVNGGLKNLDIVVCSINYRHAPEHRYPTASDDSLRGLQWLIEPQIMETYGLDPENLVIGGLSAGAHLAAILSMQAADSSLDVRPMYQLLICPVIDNTATTSDTWSKSRHSPWLTPQRMSWYRRQYFNTVANVTSEMASDWRASPCFAPTDLLRKSPKTHIAVAECDLLAPEGISYGEKLKSLGVDAEIRIYKGATHSVLILAEVLGKNYNRSEAPIVPAA